MSWIGDSGGEMTLTRDAPADPPGDRDGDLQAARRRQRALAIGANGGIVSVDIVPLADGCAGLETIVKRPNGLGFGFDGYLEVLDTDGTLTVRISIDESLTGVREAAVSAKMFELGQIDMAALMSGTPGPGGGRRIQELQPRDPYDAAIDDDATCAPSDDARLDPLFPGHPLTIIRATLQRVRTTWATGMSPVAGDASVPLQMPAGARQFLSDAVVLELYWGTGRNDLLEAHLQKALSAADSADGDVATARLWTMLGVVQHNASKPLMALQSLRRADELLTAALGDHRETACALVLRGRTERFLGRPGDAERSLRRAAAILERTPHPGMHLWNALSLLGQTLVELERTEEAASVLERLQLLPEPPARNGPAPLHVLVGILDSGVTAKTKTVPLPRRSEP